MSARLPWLSPLRSWSFVIGGLLAVWVALWGSVSPVVLVSGLLLVLGVTVLFPPRADARLALHPWRLLVLAWFTVVDVLVSGVAVAWAAVRSGPRTRSVLIEVPLQADSALVVSSVVQLTSLSPGSLVMEVDRERQVGYVHVLPVPDETTMEKRREQISRAQERTVRALVVDRPGDRRRRGRGEESR